MSMLLAGCTSDGGGGTLGGAGEGGGSRGEDPRNVHVDESGAFTGPFEKHWSYWFNDTRYKSFLVQLAYLNPPNEDEWTLRDYNVLWTRADGSKAIDFSHASWTAHEPYNAIYHAPLPGGEWRTGEWKLDVSASSGEVLYEFTVEILY